MPGLRRPLEDCTGAAANPASVNTDDGYPTIVNEMANNYPEYLTQYTGNWYFQLMYANPYPYSVGPYYGPTYHTSSFNWNCALAAIGSATTAASTIAQRIVSNPSAYGAAATNVAKLFLAGLTSGGAAWTAAEFFTAIAAILTAADLIALLTAVGFTIITVLIIIKCTG